MNKSQLYTPHTELSKLVCCDLICTGFCAQFNGWGRFKNSPCLGQHHSVMPPLRMDEVTCIEIPKHLMTPWALYFCIFPLHHRFSQNLHSLSPHQRSSHKYKCVSACSHFVAISLERGHYNVHQFSKHCCSFKLLKLILFFASLQAANMLFSYLLIITLF